MTSHTFWLVFKIAKTFSVSLKKLTKIEAVSRDLSSYAVLGFFLWILDYCKNAET